MVTAVPWTICDELFESMGPIISGDESDYNTGYDRFAISVFDHWLTTTELALEEQNHYLGQSTDIYGRKLKAFFRELYSYTTVIGVIRGDDARARLINYETIEEYLSYIIMGLDEELCVKLILPQKRIVMFSEINHTWPIFFHKSVGHDRAFLSLLKKHGVYLLSAE